MFTFVALDLFTTAWGLQLTPHMQEMNLLVTPVTLPFLTVLLFVVVAYLTREMLHTNNRKLWTLFSVSLALRVLVVANNTYVLWLYYLHF